MNHIALNNLIDILKTKTFVINLYKNNEKNIYFDSDSYNKVSHNILNKSDNSIILETTIDKTRVIYHIYTSTKYPEISDDDDNYPIPIIMLANNNSIQYNKININVYNKETLAMHYPTALKHINLSIHHVNNITFDLKASVDSSSTDFKILYHPKYMKHPKYLIYKRSNNNILISEDYRKCLPVSL
jgi:hypothetical protein